MSGNTIVKFPHHEGLTSLNCNIKKARKLARKTIHNKEHKIIPRKRKYDFFTFAI